MITAAELAEHQADAEERMLDTCRITRSTAPVDPEDREMNPVTLAYEDPAPVTVYEGKCRIPRKGGSSASSSAQAADSGTASWQVDEYPIAIPVTGDGYTDGETVAIGQVVTYLTSQRDPDLVGRSFGLTGVSHQTEAVERRFRMKEVVGT